MFVLPKLISPLIAPKKKPTGLSSLFAVLAIVALPFTSFSICAEELDRIVAIVEQDVVMQSELNEQAAGVKFQR